MIKWRVIKDTKYNGAMNMAIDEAIMVAHEKEKIPPTIRFYQWSPPAVSLGYFQDLQKEINIDACRNSGIDIVRRPTGGKAVLHDRELTYSFVIGEGHALINSSILKTYKKISRALILALEPLEIHADLVPLREKSDKDYVKNIARDSFSFKSNCFSAPSQYEVQVDGKKIIGSAQVRKRGVVLQHGSLLMEIDREKWFSVFNYPSEKILNKVKTRFKATSIEEIIKEKISFSKLSNLLPKGFEKEFHVQLIDGKLTEFEENLSRQLFETKYSSTEWNFKKAV